MPKGNLSLAFLHVDWKSLGCREGKGNATSVPHSRAPCSVGRPQRGEERGIPSFIYPRWRGVRPKWQNEFLCQPAAEASHLYSQWPP